jgi:hypothetical protein
MMVAGMGTAPSLKQPSITSYQSLMRGSITKTRSPLATPCDARKRAARSEEAARSAKVKRRTSPPSGPTATSASFPGSRPAQSSTTSRA